MSKIYLVWRLSIFLAAVILFSSAKGCAQGWVEQRTFVSAGEVAPRIDGLLNQSGRGKWGTFQWFQIQRNYSEAYAGATFSPKTWMQLAMGGGLEEDRHPLRVGGYVWVGNAKTSILINPEYGGSGGWWKIEVLQAVSKSVSIGFLQERYKGSGVEFRYKIPKTRAAVWVAPVVSRNSASHRLQLNTIFAIRWTL